MEEELSSELESSLETDELSFSSDEEDEDKLGNVKVQLVNTRSDINEKTVADFFILISLFSIEFF